MQEKITDLEELVEPLHGVEVTHQPAEVDEQILRVDGRDSRFRLAQHESLTCGRQALSSLHTILVLLEQVSEEQNKTHTMYGFQSPLLCFSCGLSNMIKASG